jgi:hypothetical protein
MRPLCIRRAAIVSLAVVSAGCAADATSSPRAEYAPKATATTLVPDAVPMVLETKLPLHAPSAQLIAGTDGREVAQTGFLFRSAWATKRSAFLTPMPLRSPWPKPLTIVDPDTATVAIDTTALPDWVVIKTYATVSGFRLTPDAPPIAEIECIRFTEPKCTFTTTGSRLRIHYDPRRVFTGSYITVFAVWHVPLEDQLPQLLNPDQVVTSYLFHVASRSEQEASLP